jgi:alkylated DNA repair dioxygenase AlkB
MQQADAFGGAPLPPGFTYRPAWLEDPKKWFECLWECLDWREQEIVLFGRRVMQPRLVAWSADEGVRYRYSGISLGPVAWPEALDELRKRLDTAYGTRFNSVLCNAYRDGRDSMGWHADDEPELGPAPVIASVSLGATRRFRIRPRRGGASVGIDLEPGSLLMMSGNSQRDYQHAVPKTRRPVGPRINLTFREVAAPVGAGRD